MQKALSTTPLLTAQEVADRLSVSRGLVYKMANEGKLPFVRIAPTCLRFKPDDIERFISLRGGLAGGVRL